MALLVPIRREPPEPVASVLARIDATAGERSPEEIAALEAVVGEREPGSAAAD